VKRNKTPERGKGKDRGHPIRQKVGGVFPFKPPMGVTSQLDLVEGMVKCRKER